MVMMEKKMMSPFNRLSKQSKQKTIQARYLVFASLIGLFVISLITTNQSSTSVRSSLRALEVQPPNATIVSDIREVLDLVDDKSSSSGSSDGKVVLSQVEGATNVHEEATDSPEEVLSRVATVEREDDVGVGTVDTTGVTDRDDDDETNNVDTTPSTTDSISLQERLLARSIEVRTIISETLSEAAAHIPSPKYFHFKPQYEEEGPTDHSCDQEDAYAGVAVDGWLPPQYGYSMESLNVWYIAYEDRNRKIKNKDAGGSVLRDFAAKETKKLRELRHRLFCVDD